jgi:peptidoglycan/LPS O-acetylase OafA/YrhL
MAANRGIQYIPAIDGLRAVAVIAVMFYHFGIFMDSWRTSSGVDLFFVISGYVITRASPTIPSHKVEASIFEVSIARARRLLPALILHACIHNNRYRYLGTRHS